MENKSIRISEDQYCCYRKLENDGIRIIWELTGQCNLRCKHCFVNKETHDNDIDKDLTLKICQELCESGVKKVMLTGGEPLLFKYFSDVISYLKSHSSMIIDITTNGILCSDKMIDLFCQIGIDELSISLDGPPDVYTIIRGEDSLKNVLLNVSKLSMASIKIDAIMTINRINMNCIKETIDLAYKSGFASITISNLLKLHNSSFDYDALCLSAEEISNVKRQIDELRQIYNTVFPIRSVGFSTNKKHSIPMKCNNPRLYAINRKGNMVKCLNANYEDIVCVDLRDHTILESMKIINESKFVHCFMA